MPCKCLKMALKEFLCATISTFLLLNTFRAIVLYQNGIILLTVSSIDSTAGKAACGMCEYFSS